MADFEPGNLLMGPATVYLGLNGVATVEPLDANVNDTPAPSAWENVGITLGGVTTKISPDYKELKGDQMPDELGAQMTGRKITVSVPLTELTLKNIARGNKGTYSGTPASGESFELTSGPSAFKQPYNKLLLDGFAPDPSGAERRRRLILRRVLQTGESEITQGPDNQQVLSYLYAAYYVSPTVGPIYYFDAPIP